MTHHVAPKVGQEAAPAYIKAAAEKKIDKIKELQDLIHSLKTRVHKLREQPVSLPNERALQATAGLMEKTIMDLGRLEGELGPEVQVNVMVQVKEQLVALLNLLPADVRAQAYVILKEKATL
jgi:hypothetical protein